MSLRTMVQGASMSNDIAAGLSTFTRRHQTMNRPVSGCDRLGKDPDDDRRYVVLSMSPVFQGCGERRGPVMGGNTHLEKRHVLHEAPRHTACCGASALRELRVRMECVVVPSSPVISHGPSGR
jgi:hypothetical protein